MKITVMTNAPKEGLHLKLEHKMRARDLPTVQGEESFPAKVITGQKFVDEQTKRTGRV